MPLHTYYGFAVSKLFHGVGHCDGCQGHGVETLACRSGVYHCIFSGVYLEKKINGKQSDECCTTLEPPNTDLTQLHEQVSGQVTPESELYDVQDYFSRFESWWKLVCEHGKATACHVEQVAQQFILFNVNSGHDKPLLTTFKSALRNDPDVITDRSSLPIGTTWFLWLFATGNFLRLPHACFQWSLYGCSRYSIQLGSSTVRLSCSNALVTPGYV